MPEHLVVVMQRIAQRLGHGRQIVAYEIEGRVGNESRLKNAPAFERIGTVDLRLRQPRFWRRWFEPAQGALPEKACGACRIGCRRRTRGTYFYVHGCYREMGSRTADRPSAFQAEASA